MCVEQYFKKCSKCLFQWRDRREFLSDARIKLNGYQVSLKNLESGLLLFTHMLDDCRTTMGVPIIVFLDFYSGERFPENKALSAECPRYCVDEKRLDRCNVLCECAFVREVIQEIIIFNNQSIPDSLL